MAGAPVLLDYSSLLWTVVSMAWFCVLCDELCAMMADAWHACVVHHEILSAGLCTPLLLSMTHAVDSVEAACSIAAMCFASRRYCHGVSMQ